MALNEKIISVKLCSKCKQALISEFSHEQVTLKYINDPQYCCNACSNAKQKDDISKIITEINENRTRMIDLFISAFISVNGPETIDYEWVLNNCVLCHRSVFENGQMIEQHWIELNRPIKK